ncbi:MAG: M55 family metallopeptidase [Fidelibacterota bacterium]
MKVYISVDMEGIAATAVWDEVDHKHKDYPLFQNQMTAEAAAACEGALAGGATEIVVKDAHASGRNIDASALPKEARLIRGWSGHPYSMMQELDDSFTCALMIGYHSRTGSGGNPLSHTMTGKATEITINDIKTSEFLLNSFTAALHQVPVIFLSGDEALCEHAKKLIPSINTVGVKRGVGNSVVTIHPEKVVEEIKSVVAQTLPGETTSCLLELPKHFKIKIRFHKPKDAYKASFYPGMILEDDQIVSFETDDWMESLRMIHFVL